MRSSTIFAVILLGAAPARAAAGDDRRFVSLTVENDLFGNTDQGYTSGLRLSVLQPEGKRPFLTSFGLEKLLPAADGVPIRFETAIGQSTFTPRNTATRRADPLDRPYAGFTYAAFGVAAVSPAGAAGARRLDQLELTLGIIGPASLAGDFQRTWHKWFGFRRPNGWEDQLRNEPAINLSYRRSLRSPPARLAGISADVTPHAGFAVGNVYTHASGGATIRIGSDLPGLGVSRVEPAVPGSAYFDRFTRPHLYAFAGVDGRAVARNIFLDGNSFRSGPRVDKRAFVADFELGAVAVLGRARLAYTHVWRTSEFVGQRQCASFGSLNASVAF